MKISVLFLFAVCLSITTATPILEIADLSKVKAETSSRIVNGYAVDITEVPYQASLRRRTTSSWAHMCGAVIITNRAVLTAAHCADGFQLDPSSIRIVVGTSSRASGGKSYDVSKIIIHQEYSPATLENDIALVGTASMISFSQSISPIPFASSGFILPDGAEAIVSGFGTTSFEGMTSSILLAAKVKIVNQDSCARTYLRMATITSGMVCAGATNPPRDACQGDSGGPLVANGYLVGIVSWGEGCADTVYPGVYTRVSHYSSWIGANHNNIGN